MNPPGLRHQGDTVFFGQYRRFSTSQPQTSILKRILTLFSCINLQLNEQTGIIIRKLRQIGEKGRYKASPVEKQQQGRRTGQNHLDPVSNFERTSLTRPAIGESGSSCRNWRYSSCARRFSPRSLRTCAAIRWALANFLWSGNECTFCALARACSDSPFFSCVLARAVRICGFRGVALLA